MKRVLLSYEKTGILAAVDSLEKNFGVAMSNAKRALARLSIFPISQASPVHCMLLIPTKLADATQHRQTHTCVKTDGLI